MQKSILVPCQSITYLGVCYDSVEMRARLSQERSAAILSSLRHFRLGSYVHLKKFQRLLGLMASAYVITTHAPSTVMAEISIPLDSVDFGPSEHRGLPRQSSEAVVQPRALQPGSSPGLSDVTCHGNDGRINSQLGSSVRRHANFGAVVRTAEPVAHKPLGAGSSVLSSKGFSAVAGTATFTDSHRQHVCSVLYKPPGRHSLQSSVRTGSGSPAMGGPYFLSIRAAHIPGLLNRGADMLLRKGIPQGEWRLQPESVRMIWTRFGRAEVDLFTTRENAHCPLFFSLSHSPLEGGALTSHWPAARL